MGLKHGYIVEEDTPVSAGAAHIRRFRMSNGDHVYLPLAIAARLISQHSPAEELFFLEKGFMGRTAWAGNLHELRVAVARGEIPPRELSGYQLPPQESAPGWDTLAEEDDHAMVGEKLGELQTVVERRGMTETAANLSIEAWVANARSEGACLAERPDRMHGRLWCELDRNHDDYHRPACPKCDLVKVIVFASAQQAGFWR